MYKNIKIETTNWGLIITLNGRLCRYGLEALDSDFIEPIFSKLPKNFHMLVNMIDVEPICEDVAKIMVIVQAYLNGRGLKRSVIVYNSNSQINELNRALVNASSFSKYARYISKHTYANYMKPAMDWLLNEVEP